MTRLFNRSEETAKRRKLRRNLAPAEALLWTQLQGRKVLGYKFRRQYGVGVFVIDFYCLALKLSRGPKVFAVPAQSAKADFVPAVAVTLVAG